MASSLFARFCALKSPCRISYLMARSIMVHVKSVHYQLHASYFAHRRFSAVNPLPQKNTVSLNFSLPGGVKKTATAKIGDNILDVVLENDLDIDGFGACEGTLACSTCHLIFLQKDFDTLSDKPTDEELDMLDLAYGLEDTSRLGCQVIVTKEMDGWEISVPSGMADAR